MASTRLLRRLLYFAKAQLEGGGFCFDPGVDAALVERFQVLLGFALGQVALKGNLATGEQSFNGADVALNSSARLSLAVVVSTPGIRPPSNTMLKRVSLMPGILVSES